MVSEGALTKLHFAVPDQSDGAVFLERCAAVLREHNLALRRAGFEVPPTIPSARTSVYSRYLILNLIRGRFVSRGVMPAKNVRACMDGASHLRSYLSLTLTSEELRACMEVVEGECRGVLHVCDAFTQAKV